MKNKTRGFRGYIGSRSYDGCDFTQHVQNLLIRNYCQKYQMKYLLSATEYTMPGCYMMMEEVLNSSNSIDGIVLFSIFMLPKSVQKRERIYQKILSAGLSLHAALEDLSIHTAVDIQGIEDILNLNKIAMMESAIQELENFFVA
ncbi:MAG: sporadic carbohydrate cluster protein, TIGR04323 family [Gammaproteobacteria bacterium]|nr:sporadic carbohydrate cluster protein, TIGR04323 family [Gammaproteobacteria bacterium]